jgi:hypothetical protein
VIVARADPLLVAARVAEGVIAADVDDSTLIGALGEGRIVILKGVFASDDMIRLRDAAMRWAREEPEFPDGQSPDDTPTVNYHRFDDGTYRSAIPHIFHQYGLNALDELPAYFRDPASTVTALLTDLQNRVARTNLDISVQGLRTKIHHYPRGGGFFGKHVHPLEPQRVGLILSLSRLGVDAQGGGTTFETPAGTVDTSEYHDIGDIAMFRYDLPHVVAPVDPGVPVDWDADTGKWSVVLDVRSNNRRSRSLGQGN